MIRTAILTGILLILISIAYSKPDQNTPAQAVLAALPDEQPVPKAVPKPLAQHARAQTEIKRLTPVEDEDTSETAAADLPTAAPVPAPVQEEPRLAPAHVADVAPVAKPEPKSEPTPTLLLPPPNAPAIAAEAQAPAPVAAEVAPSKATAPQSLLPATADVTPVAPAPQPAPQIAQVPPPPAAALPTVSVATRPNVMPWEAPAGTTHNSNVATVADLPNETSVAAANGAAAPAPKFMTPQERSRDLHRLARDMEDTFITKLAH